MGCRPIDAQHQLNFSQLVKSTPQPAPTPSAIPAPAAPSPVTEAPPSKLPALSGNIKLTHSHITFSQPGSTAYINNIEGEIKIPDINQPITDSLSFTMKAGNSAEGSFKTSGTAAVVKQNSVDLNSAEIHQTVEATNIDLQSAKAFVSRLDTLEGALAIHIALDVTNGKDVTLDAAITGQKPIAVGGEMLKGDVVRTNAFSTTVPKLTASFPDGLAKWQTGRVKVSPIAVKLDQGNIAIDMDAVPQALLNMIDHKAPGYDGSIVFNSDFDLSKIIPQLRNRIGLPEGLQISSGGVSQKITLAMTPAKADLSSATNTTQLVGTQPGENHTTKSLLLDPIHESLSASYQGGTDVRQIDLKIASKSINGEFTGTSVADLHGNLNADLNSLSAELGQFLASKLNLGGNMAVTIASTGAAGNSQLTIGLTGKNLQYTSTTGSPITEPNLLLTLDAHLLGDSDNPAQIIQNLKLTLKTGDTNAPTIDLLAEAPRIKLGDDVAAEFHLTHLVADLAKLQNQFAPVAAKTDGTIVNQGILIITAQGAKNGAAISIDQMKITADHLLFTHQTADGNRTAPVDAGSLRLDGSATKADGNTAINLTGDLADLTRVVAVYEGKPVDAYPYRGTYALAETVATVDGRTSLQGRFNVAKFQTFSGSTASFSDDMLAIANNVTIDSSNGDESINITSFTADAQSTHAFKFAIANGSIQHVPTRRDLNLKPTLDYDLAKVWPIVQPIMGDKYKTLKITGQFSKQFNITGSYPANQPSTVAIKTLHVDGDLSVASFDYDGLNLQNFIVPFVLDGGQLVTVYANKSAGQNTAPPALGNGGTIDLGDLTIDLTQSPPRLTTPANKVLLAHVTINPLFADSYLAKFLNNPLFVGTKEATGLFDLTLTACNALPLGDLVTENVPANSGSVAMKFSLTDITISSPLTSDLAPILKQAKFTANVKDGTVAVAKGISTEHIQFLTGPYSLGFDGDVRLADEHFVPLNLSIGPVRVMFEKGGMHDANWLKYLPDRFSVPVEGSMQSWRLGDLAGEVRKLATDAAAKAVTEGLLGKDQNGKSPLDGLLKKIK
jgi:hypothetical protein